jgi:hypothetical protein
VTADVLQDPRTGIARRHELLEMLLIALCTVLCGGEDCPIWRNSPAPSWSSYAAS